MAVEIKGQLALVTGGTGGIGKATCLALADLGCNIAVHYNKASETARSLVTELKGKGVKAEAFQADLRDYDEV
jgi:3-oxoacyl-[acyl-carrier protein] reductase